MRAHLLPSRFERFAPRWNWWKAFYGTVKTVPYKVLRIWLVGAIHESPDTDHKK